MHLTFVEKGLFCLHKVNRQEVQRTKREQSPEICTYIVRDDELRLEHVCILHFY